MQYSWSIIAILAYVAVYAVLCLRVSRNLAATLTVLLLAAFTFASWLFMDAPLYSVIVMYALASLVFAFRFGEPAAKLLALIFTAMNLFQCLWVVGRLRSALAAQGLDLGEVLLLGANVAVLDGLVYILGRNFTLFLACLAAAFMIEKVGKRRKERSGRGR